MLAHERQVSVRRLGKVLLFAITTRQRQLGALLLPAAGVLSLEDHGAVAGSASALLGAIQMITAAVSMTLVGVYADHTPAPMLIGIALCAVAALLTVIWTLSRLPAHLVSPPPSS